MNVELKSSRREERRAACPPREHASAARTRARTSATKVVPFVRGLGFTRHIGFTGNGVLHYQRNYCPRRTRRLTRLARQNHRRFRRPSSAEAPHFAESSVSSREAERERERASFSGLSKAAFVYAACLAGSDRVEL